MSKEFDKKYDIRQTTPENTWDKIREYLDGLKLGSVKFIAFCDALELSEAINVLHASRRIREISKNGGSIPDQLKGEYKSKADIKSKLRMAETRYVLAESNIKRNESILQGYTESEIFSLDAITRFEKHNVKTQNYGLLDTRLEELRRITNAHENLHDAISGIKMGEK